jgi:hypothetical protein
MHRDPGSGLLYVLFGIWMIFRMLLPAIVASAAGIAAVLGFMYALKKSRENPPKDL